RFRFIQTSIRFLPARDAPTTCYLHIRCETAERENFDQGVCITGHVDRRDSVADCVGNIKRATVRAQIQIARVGSLKLCCAGRYLSKLREERPRINAKRANLIFESVGDVK